MPTLLKRILSAAAVLVLLWSVYYFFEANGLVVFVNLIILLGVREFLNFLNLKGPLNLKVGGVLFVAAILTLFIFNLNLNYKLAHMAALLGAVNFSLILILRNQNDASLVLRTITYSFIGLIVYVCFPANIVLILKSTDGAQHFLNLLMLVFFGDTFAYFAGKNIGGPKLAPVMSPKKTISGSIGSIIGSVVAGLLMVYFQSIPMSWLYLGIVILLSVVAQSGDLFESIFKRVANIKDSGSIMPGHGGVLDRLDALYFGAPIYVLFLVYFNK